MRQDFWLCRTPPCAQSTQGASDPIPRQHFLCGEGLPRAGFPIMTRETLSKEADDLSWDSCGLAPATNHGALHGACFFLFPDLTFTFTPVRALRSPKCPNPPFRDNSLFPQGLSLPRRPAKFPLEFCGAGGRASEVQTSGLFPLL